jgi:hypothetical protein
VGSALARAGLLALIVAAGFGISLAGPRRDARACGAAGPYDFDTYEPEDYAGTYNKAINLVAEGKAVTFQFALPGGEVVDLRYQGLKSGPRAARVPENPGLRIAPSVYKSIAWIESNWSNGAGAVPYGGVGPVLRSFDCGYGIGQVTSGMSNPTGTPSARQAIIGTDYLFNLAEGARILADKWNSAPKYRPIAGNGDPASIEDWYYAIWSYNGFAFSNHPLNPNRNPLRGGSDPAHPIYHCYDPSAPSYQTSNGVVMFNYGDYTYPERVYGCMRYPPKKSTNAQSLPLESGEVTAQAAEPKFKPGDIAVITGTGDCLRIRPVPAGEPPIICLPDGTQLTVLGGPQDAGGKVWWNVTTPANQTGWAADEYLRLKSTTPPPPPPPPAGGPPQTIPEVDPTGRLWPPQKFFMPEMTSAAVSAAFGPAYFLACEDEGFGGGCPLMDFPTTVPDKNIVPHADTTPSSDALQAAALLGDPKLAYKGPTELALATRPDGTASSGTVIVTNVGKGVGPFRIRTSASWIAVRHPLDAATRTLDGGVAVGHELDVVVQGANPIQGKLRIAQKGYDSTLVITLLPEAMPPGTLHGAVWIEPLLGGGGVFQVNITATHGAAGPVSYKSVAPALSADP